MSAGRREHHPALRMYLLTILLLALTVLLGFIAVFVPWVQKDIAIGVRAWAYPFKTCFEDTFSPVNAESCMDNDFIVGSAGAPVSGGDATCRAFVLTTIAFVFISVIGGVVLLLLLAVIVERLWSRPTFLACFAQLFLTVVCIACFLAWIFFICFAESTCIEGSIFPVRGYSYGFICYIFATALSLASVVTGFMGLSKLRQYQPIEDKSIDEEIVVMAEAPPAYTYPEYPDVPSNMPSPTPHSDSFNAAAQPSGAMY